MKRYGLIGYPLTHSFSQRFFTEKFSQEGILDCLYENFPIAAIGDLPQIIRDRPDLCGLNVTIPYKEKVIPYLHATNAVVAAIGACNCIRMEGQELHGFNTDTEGFRRSLLTLLRPGHRKALVLGGGGAAKAVLYVLDELGLDVLQVVRKGGLERPHLHYTELGPSIMADHTLIVNTTPLGTYPDVDAAPPLPYEYLTSRHHLYDLVYNPPETLFLKKGRERGATVQNGADMLIIQAEESWRIWNQ